MPEVLNLTLQAWNSIPLKVFQSSWIVAGYFNANHFPAVDDSPADMTAAQKVLDPAGLLNACSLPGTPQFCDKFEWQVQDCRSKPFCAVLL